MSYVFPLSEPVLNKLSAGECMLVNACELHFKDGVFRAHTGTGEIIINGYSYIGLRKLGSIGSIKESSDSQGAYSVDMNLSGIDTEIINETLVNKCRGKLGKIYFVAVGKDGSTAANIICSGRMGAAQFKIGTGETSNVITIPLEDRMAEWDRPGVDRFTQESHIKDYPGDDFFQYVGQVAVGEIFWGSKKDGASLKDG